MPNNPVFCAIDTIDITKAKQLIQTISPHIGGVKLGLEFFTHHGAKGVQEVMPADVPLFLDLKFHDIPNTVAGAIKATSGISAYMMTIHAIGGRDMMKAAMEAAHDIAARTHRPRPKIIGVTVLTSMNEEDMYEVGVNGNVQEQVKRLAALAQESGLDGVVCSAHEIEFVRNVCGNDFTLVVPGIRPEGSNAGDQKRIMTPKQAMQKGATHLVIGRPITESASPLNAAQAIAASL